MSKVPALPCLCESLRRAASLVSQLYENEPGWPKSLSVDEFSVMQAIAHGETISYARLGWLLGLDQTTVSRSLAALGKRGWLSVARGRDRREPRVALSAEGRQELRRVNRPWRRVHARLRRRYGAAEWQRLERALTLLARASSIQVTLLESSPVPSVRYRKGKRN